MIPQVEPEDMFFPKIGFPGSTPGQAYRHQALVPPHNFGAKRH
jgi:hypothetical protein